MSFAGDPPSYPPTWVKDFPVVGQGVIIFNVERSTDFGIFISPSVADGEPGWDEWISLAVTDNTATFRMKHNSEIMQLGNASNVTVNKTAGYYQDVGYESDRTIAYWVSYNRDLLQVKYGKGYVMEEATVLSVDFLKGQPISEQEKIREKYANLFSPYVRRKIEFYDILPKEKLVSVYQKKILEGKALSGVASKKLAAAGQGVGSKVQDKEAEELSKGLIDVEKKVQLMPNPFVSNRSPIILDSDNVTLEILDSNDYTFSASLPETCLELYSNIIKSELNSRQDPFPLSDAIQYSIDTEGCELNNKLKSKSEFGDPKFNYLRVTCGPTRGKSAGIPYVLEIWPQQHGSVIHNHGNCFAVIKVLYGGLDITLYNKHTTTLDQTPVRTISVKEGDATWISPNWFQTHNLWNIHDKKFCATIQCYQYGKMDMIEYPYFDYVNDEELIAEFLPDSDYTFNQLKNIVMAEYADYMKHLREADEKTRKK